MFARKEKLTPIVTVNAAPSAHSVEKAADHARIPLTEKTKCTTAVHRTEDTHLHTLPTDIRDTPLPATHLTHHHLCMATLRSSHRMPTSTAHRHSLACRTTNHDRHGSSVTYQHIPVTRHRSEADLRREEAVDTLRICRGRLAMVSEAAI